MKQYHDLLEEVLIHGFDKGDRTGTGTISLFGTRMEFDMADGFPLVTTKKLHIKSIIHELLWFISGNTNIKYLKENGVRIWDEWADYKGDLGPVYGKQWRAWETLIPQEVSKNEAKVMIRAQIDQLGGVIKKIKERPDDRRLIVSAWNPGEIHRMALPPCHMMFQFYVAGGELSLQMYQRSADMFLGVPFNIASYSLLLHMVAHVTGLRPGKFIWVGGDTHIYSNHIEQVNEQLNRECTGLPVLKINREVKKIDDFKFEDFEIIGYHPHPAIKAKVAV